MSFIISKAKSLATGSVVVRGEEVCISAVSASSTDLINKLYPRPVPKTLTQNPNGGSLATLIPDTNEPGFADLRSEWEARMQSMVCVLGTDLRLGEDDGGVKVLADLKQEKQLEWFNERVVALRSAWTMSEICSVFVAIMDLGDFSRIRSALVEADDTPVGQRADQIHAQKKFKLPPRYRITDVAMWLRVCSRYGIDPFKTAAPEYDVPGLWEMLVNQESVFMQERDREIEAAAGAGGE